MSQIPYALLRDILSASFEIHDNDSAAMARQKLERGILSHTGSAETATLHAHFIGHLIGFDFSASPHLKGILGESRQIRDLAFHYGAQLFTEIARERTAVILLEDLHWADKGTLDFFDHLMNTKPDLPLMIVGLTRATLFEQRPDWGSGPIDNVRLDLAPLSEQDSRRLVAEILKKAPEIPSALTDFIVDKAQGSPYYIEELARSLINGGIIIRGEEQWTVEMDRLSDLRVPATLTGLLQARLDRLNADLRETLQQASVVGRIFWSNVVEGMQNPEAHYASSSGTIHDRLDILRSNELVHRYNESASAELPAYIFRNIILHDVTYESVLLKLRPVYHLQAAEGLVAAGGERVSEYAGRVGEHFEHAGEWLKAAEWYARAGRQAQDTYAPDSATAYYEKALKFLDEHGGPVQTPQRLEILARLGEVLNWQARYTDAVETYSTMLKIAEEKGDPVAQSRALQGRAISLEYQGDHRAALESAGRAEGLARSSDAQVELARALWTQGLARYRLGEPQATLSLSEMALAILNEKNNPNEAGRFLNLLGTAYYGMGEYEQAQHHWENTLRIFQRLGNKQQGMDLLNNLGVIADARGDYEAAFRRYSEALELAREVGNRDGEIVFLSNRGIEQVALKNYTAAEADLRQTIEMAGTAGSWCLPNTYNYLAEALLGLGKYDEALHAAQQGLALSIEDGSPENIGGAWRALGLIACKIEEPVKIKGGKRGRSKAYSAHACFAESDRIYSEAEITGERARNLREWAKYEIGQGDKDLGLKMWQEARDLFGKLGAQMEVERMS
jgi:tetratricopeptide (TPR) repeat protein